MKNFLSKKHFVGLSILVVVLGVIFFRSGNSASETEAGIGKVIKQDLLQRVTIAGVIEPLSKTIVTAPYNGYIKKLFVKVGDKVKKGDPLVSVVQSLVVGDDVYPLRSPLNGTVVQIQLTEGEYVKDGDTTEFIMRIDDTEKLFVTANAPEIDRVKVKLNQEAVIKASAILDRSYKGIIREMSLAARAKERWSRNEAVEFPIKVEITNPDEKLHPGMSVVLDVITEKREKVLTLRHEFIRRDDDGQYFVLTEDGQRKDIKVGIQNEEGFEVLSGLKENDRVKLVDFASLVTE